MNDERWRQLCEQAAVETNPDRLMELIEEINRLLSEREARIRGHSGAPTARSGNDRDPQP